MRGKEERAIYVHCRAHYLNLVAQDSVENQIEIRNIMNLVQSFIAFARGSPKRLACFNKFRNVEYVESGASLRPFYPLDGSLENRPLYLLRATIPPLSTG